MSKRNKELFKDDLNENLTTINSRPLYFGAVIDVESRYGTMDEIAAGDNVSNIRYFNDKFVDSPEKALAVACDLDNIRHRYVGAIRNVMENVKFDRENSEYVLTVWRTSNYNAPTEKQWTRFKNAEPGFRFYREIYRIQVYETTLVHKNLIPAAAAMDFGISGR